MSMSHAVQGQGAQAVLAAGDQGDIRCLCRSSRDEPHGCDGHSASDVSLGEEVLRDLYSTERINGKEQSAGAAFPGQAVGSEGCG